MKAFPMKSREREPAVRLAGAGVPDEKDSRLRGMGFGFAAETALDGLECFRAGDVAGASAGDFGAEGREGAQS